MCRRSATPSTKRYKIGYSERSRVANGYNQHLPGQNNVSYNQHLHGQNNVCRGANQQVIEMLDSIAPLDAAIAPL